MCRNGIPRVWEGSDCLLLVLVSARGFAAERSPVRALSGFRSGNPHVATSCLPAGSVLRWAIHGVSLYLAATSHISQLLTMMNPDRQALGVPDPLRQLRA